MDKRIRIVGLVLVVCFGLVLLQLNNWQVRESSSLSKKSQTYFPPTSSFDLPRGEILSSDGYVLAQSVPTKDSYGYLREYSQGPLFADITGYFDPTAFAAPYGIEEEYNADLIQHESSQSGLSGLLTEHAGTDSVVLTTSVALQKTAQTALDGKIGAVVVLGVKTGDVLAMYSNPTYDPNLLASHDPKKAAAAFTSDEDLSDPSASPLINGATAQTYPPGSTFKIVTTSAMFDHFPSLTKKIWPAIPDTALPDTDKTLSNFDGEVCGGDLAEIFAQSCDTAFGLIGITLDATRLYKEASAFGFNKTPPLDIPGVEPAEFPSVKSFAGNKPFLAYSAIGQEDVRETALEDALIAAGIANNGVIMAPHLMASIVDDEGSVVQTYKDHKWVTATSASTATSVRSLMRGVVETGTASEVGFPASLDVAAKTGTAETSTNNCSTNWLVAMAPAGPGMTPKVAVAAVIPDQPGLPAGCDGTGAVVAGPVVRTVLEAALGYTG